ncbi:Na(+)/citrate cotransporter-like [Ornithodoros turicata]|uniref:Na(+)/citrate cotransporter-like n=1 Tax=Ornithodoros turicata TaxID=34597 RepID=UPI003138DAC3
MASPEPTTTIRGWLRILLGHCMPVIVAPMFLIEDERLWCVGVFLWMVTWDLLETVPTAMASMLPFLLFPLLDVVDVEELAQASMSDNLILIHLGTGILIASTEDTPLSTRLSLYLLDTFGCSMRAIILGLTVTTFLSTQFFMGGATTVFMSSVVETTVFELEHDIITATMAKAVQQRQRTVRTTLEEDCILTPISVVFISPRTSTTASGAPSLSTADPVSRTLLDVTRGRSSSALVDTTFSSDTPVDPRLQGSESGTSEHKAEVDVDPSTAKPSKKRNSILRRPSVAKLIAVESERFQQIKKALLINIAYCASVSGLANIPSSMSGIFLRDHLRYEYGWDDFSFISWMAVGLPIASASVVVISCLMYFCYLKQHELKETAMSEENILEVIKRKRQFLGHFRLKECVILVAIMALVIIWIFRKSNDYFIGWEKYLGIKDTHEVTLVFMVIVLLSFIPEKVTSSPIIPWRYASRRIPWRSVLTIAGGLSVVELLHNKGISWLVIQKLMQLPDLTPLAAQIGLLVASSFITELQGEAVVAKLLVPIASHLAVLTNVHPLYYALPVAMASCTSALFSAPGATIGIVAAAAGIHTADVLQVAMTMKFFSLLFIITGVNIIGNDVFKWGVIPVWATNNTSRVVTPRSHRAQSASIS